MFVKNLLFKYFENLNWFLEEKPKYFLNRQYITIEKPELLWFLKTKIWFSGNILVLGGKTELGFRQKNRLFQFFKNLYLFFPEKPKYFHTLDHIIYFQCYGQIWMF